MVNFNIIAAAAMALVSDVTAQNIACSPSFRGICGWELTGTGQANAEQLQAVVKADTGKTPTLQQVHDIIYICQGSSPSWHFNKLCAAGTCEAGVNNNNPTCRDGQEAPF